MDWYRCTMQSEAEEATLTVDLLLEDSRVQRGIKYFGEISFSSYERYPIMIQPDTNLVDGGSAFEEDERFERMRLHGELVSPGACFSYKLNTDRIIELTVIGCENYARLASSRRGGRPQKRDEWTKFWLAIAVLARAGKLDRNNFRSQESLIHYIINEHDVDLSQESLKPRVSELWYELGLQE